MAAAELVGRDREKDVIMNLLNRISHQGGALLIHGEAGVGKSALLAAAAGMAQDRGMRVLTTAGVQSETNLSFAALHQLLRPALAQANNLPASQREAIRAAFGLSASGASDLFLIALAALELLSEMADRSPVLVIADDVQWLDRSSADVLAFVARRLQWDPIVLLASVRDGADNALASAGLPALRLSGLADRPARDLLEANFPELAASVRERLLQEAAGNPLALLELPMALGSGSRSGEALLPPRLPLTTRLENAFADRMAGLPVATRAFLLAAAADESGDLAEIMRATKILTGRLVSGDDLDPAVTARLISVDNATVRFRHPLVRSAMYQAAPVALRQASHAALAEVLADDPDRRAWHRASSVLGKDPEAAAGLEEVACRARRRGDLMTSLMSYERAATLSEDTGRRGRLLLQAAEAATELGRTEVIRRLLREADSLLLAPLERARSMRLGDLLDGPPPADPAAVYALTEMANTAIAEGDSDLALSLLSVAAVRCFWGNLTGEPGAAVLDVAEKTGADPDDARFLHIQAFAAPLECGAVVLKRLEKLDPPEDPGSLQLLGSAATVTGAHDRGVTFYAASAAKLRQQGRLGVLAEVLAIQSWAAIIVGDFAVALTAAEEGARLAAETAQPQWEMQNWTAQATIAALRGDNDTAEDLARRIERIALPLGAASNLALAQYARGISALAKGRNEEAYDQLWRVFQPGDPAHHELFASFDFGDLAEAAVHSGRGGQARAIMPWVESVASRTPSPWLHASLLYGRALLAGGGEAEAAFKEAAEDKNMARWPFLRARLMLAFGEWLRRQRRTAESRASLRAARDVFDALGAVPWGERARSELRAAGEASRQRSRGTLDVLTAQELQIVQMVAEGLTNREIGQRLYLSHRTVESHLYRAFPKLGITSRSQLSRVAEGSFEAMPIQ